MPDIFKAEKDTKPEIVVDQTTAAPLETKSVKKTPKSKKHIKEVRQRKYSYSGKTGNPLSSFYYFPDNVDFETRDNEEKVILLLRKHFVTNFVWIAVVLLMIAAPLLLTIFPILSFLPDGFKSVAVLGWYLITTAYFLESFLTWFFNVNIITDERIVDIDFHNLIYKEVSDANIDRIQDVTYKMGGVIRTVFNYGDVLIQTAAEVPEFQFEAIPKPDRVVAILQELRIEEEQEKIEGRVR